LDLAKSEGGIRESDTDRGDNYFTRYLYLPTTFTITVPFAAMPWGLSRVLWMALIGSSMVLAAFLMRDAGGDYSPLLVGSLAGFFLADNELLMVVGNVAGVAITLCIVATWCFVRNRYIVLGILCFAASLSLKPHDSGLVWLYFLLAGGIYRRRALQTLAATVVLILPALVWITNVSPNWIRELQANLVLDTAPGQRSDPSIASMGSHGLSMLVNLQTVFASFWSNPYIYNFAAILVCGPLLLIWIFATLRSHTSPAKTWLALASVSALTMLPLYHRQYDTKLLLLTLPGCAILWSRGGRVGRLGLLLSCAGFVLTGDLSWIGLLSLLSKLSPALGGLTDSILRYAQIFSAPLILLLIGSFYLRAYVKYEDAPLLGQDPLPHDTE
jgi:hypothetical protein